LHLFFQAEDGIRDRNVTGVQTCALPILDTNIVIFLSLAKDRIKLRISFIPIGSNPLVGSSNISSSGLWRSALAIPSLCFIPKEYLPTSFFVSLCRST